MSKIRLDPTNHNPLSFYKTIKDADSDNQKNAEFNIGEMPMGACILYKNIIYRIIDYDNTTGNMKCKKIEDNSLVDIDYTENAVYLGQRLDLIDEKDWVDHFKNIGMDHLDLWGEQFYDPIQKRNRRHLIKLPPLKCISECNYTDEFSIDFIKTLWKQSHTTREVIIECCCGKH